ncbi:MAG: DUF2298 domain-containing protein [Anaerolineae bacterium]|nr:DUF2298 domain-containing protein [Anaerolineae bacterium]
MNKSENTHYSVKLLISLGLLALVLLAGAYLRFIGVNWDDNQHLHPDERFLTMVETGLSPVNSISDYFNTETSSLNPNNRGYGFYVYGTLPIFIVRYIADALNQAGYDQVFLVGRYASGIVDLLTVFLVFLIVERLYRRPYMAVLAAAFSAFAVLQIQQSHYFTVDTFTNFFAFLAIYFAVYIATDLSVKTNKLPSGLTENLDGEAAISPEGFQVRLPDWLTKNWDSVINYVLFGMALGMALASKVSVYQIAALLPLAVLIRWFRLPIENRNDQLKIMVRNVVVAAVVSLIVFRICQPYAFAGPGFFDVKLNPKWVSNLVELKSQTDGDVDFPPALQWARRPAWFALQNMVEWGLGLPLGIFAWAAFLWMGWRMIKGEWKEHAIIWAWTGVFFAMQSQVFNPTMRYLLFVYPSLAIISAWAVFALWDARRAGSDKILLRWRWLSKSLALGLGIGVLVATAAWAFAFSRIYTRPITRVEASHWIYQNVPAAMVARVENPDGNVNIPIAFRSGTTLQGGFPLIMAFTPQNSGLLMNFSIPFIVDPVLNPEIKSLDVTVSADLEGQHVLGVGHAVDTFNNDGGESRGKSYTINIEQAPAVEAGKTYYLTFNLQGNGLKMASTPTIGIMNPDGKIVDQWLPDMVEVIKPGEIFQTNFNSISDGLINEITFTHVLDWEARPESKLLKVSVIDQTSGLIVANGTLEGPFLPGKDPRGETYTVKLNNSVPVLKEHAYTVQIQFNQGSGAIALYGARHALETSWDDPLPLGLDGFNPFDNTYGLYRSDLNFEMYWDDNQEKLKRFETILDQTDYIYITSNRQWGTTVRVPERYPLTTAYYRNLIGCPDGQDILYCYSVAEPGMYQGQLGFDLVQIVQSDPNLGSIRFNTQFAEEAFTVYDHPKVLVFKKNGDYSADAMRAILESVDLTTVIHLTPRQASKVSGNMMLPETRLLEQQTGGTWSQLFNRLAVINQIPAAGAVFWYLVFLVLGWVCFPMVRYTFAGLPDHGFPLVRTVGLLLLTFFTWILGSMGLPFSSLMVSGVFAILLIGNAALFWVQREAILDDIRQNWRRYLTAEAVFLGLFILFLLVRLGNPDLWHPYKGGEKPMDFSYLNAVIKSTTFPPYDPWFAGGYINYYYFGFVLAGVPIKWLGIMPSIAYNLILPTFFALFGAAAFSLGWNLVSVLKPQSILPDDLQEEDEYKESDPAFNGGLMAVLLALIFGNLGTVRMIWQGLMRLAVPEFEKGNLLEKIIWTFQGLAQYISNPHLSYGAGDWYWIPSRIMPGEPITEFPMFTFLYADPHAHMFALPFTLLALSWVLSLLLLKWEWTGDKPWQRWLHAGSTFVMGGLVIGVLYPTNTWDMPAYLVLGMAVVLYTGLRNSFNRLTAISEGSRWLLRLIISIGACAALAGLAFLFFRPFSQWFVQAYNAVEIWQGDRTAVSDYLTHWGVFLFIIFSWMVWETIDWMDKTPLSHLRKLFPFAALILMGFFGYAVIVVVLTVTGVNISWLVLTLALWALILILRPNQPDVKRFVLFLVGSALVMTLAVELVNLKGDIGRMNTVFKFYLQAWSLFAISAAAALMWVYPAAMRYWRLGWRGVWTMALALLLGSAALFPLLAGADKILDRMSSVAPHTLDGMAYMLTAQYSEDGHDMNLSEDYYAMQWMQDHVSGSPVIVEANIPEYRWGTRYTIYTGLPDVVGWNWHQRQQRAALGSEAVTNRVQAVGDFYNTLDIKQTLAFIKKYNVKYIIVGQLEEIVYPNGGLQKFDYYNGQYWDRVYQQGQTAIYQVK